MGYGTCMQQPEGPLSTRTNGKATAAETARPAPFERLDTFSRSSGCTVMGEQLRLVREEGARFRDVLSATGMPEYVESFDLARVPYPTEFGFFRAHPRTSPLLTFTNRLFVIRWRDASGSRGIL